ncbi:MAG: rhodanese-like domain-containing protein [Nitrolancea sp.]
MSGENQVPDVPSIDVREAWDQASKSSSYILDVREPEELEEISVPGAIHVPLGSLPTQASMLPDDRELHVICRSGVRSAFATKFLLDSGFSGTRNVRGGVIAWAESELPYMSHGENHNQEGE